MCCLGMHPSWRAWKVHLVGKAAIAMVATLGYFDPDMRRWIPLDTHREGETLVAESDHLTDYGWWDNAGWLVSRLLGARAGEPRCAGKPDWLNQLITVDTAQAQAFACAQSAGADVEVKVVNNRGYAVAVELSEKPATVRLNVSWPTSLIDLTQKLDALANSDGKVVLLPALGEATLTYPRPARPMVITGYVRLNVISALYYTLLEAVTGTFDVEYRLPGGLVVAVKAVDCARSVAAS